MIKVREINTYYGQSHILHGVSFDIKKGEAVTLLGRNGAGKTTTVKTIMGLVPARSGSILFNDTDITGMQPHTISKMGVGFVPEERRIFPSLTVLENLNFPVWGRGEEGWNLEKVYRFFPVLKSRSSNKGSQLSGGEQQMLAIARILRRKWTSFFWTNPQRDWPRFWYKVSALLSAKSRTRVSRFCSSSKTRVLPRMWADRHHILYAGKIAFEGTNQEFLNNQDVQKKFLAFRLLRCP